MTMDDCAEVRFLLLADVDEELDVGGTALVAAHVAHCPDCAAKQMAIVNLAARMRTELPACTAPARLRQAVEAAIVTSGATLIPTPAPMRSLRVAARLPWFQLVGSRMERALHFGAGVGLTAALALIMALPHGADMADGVVASHIRALQPGHLMDVVSTDQHTVKPWFDGRLDYAPPVKDLALHGFPLIGGRLDYLAGRPVAALAYHRAKHVIDFYVWPHASSIDGPVRSGERSGYNYIRWSQDEMVFWVVSDLNKAELSEFVERWRTAQ